VWACVWLLLPTEIRMSDPENSFSDTENNELLVEEKEDSDETDDELIELMIKWISKPDSPDLVQPVRRGVLELVVSPVPDFSLPEVLESVPPMGAGYVSPVARYRRYRFVDLPPWEPREPDSDEEFEEEYVPVYRLPWWHLADEVPENDGTWEEVLSPEQTRPSTPVELSANANFPIPPDEGFGEFPPTEYSCSLLQLLTPAPYSCSLLLLLTPAPYSCSLLLLLTPAPYSCSLILLSTLALYSLSLKPAPHSCFFFLFLLPAFYSSSYSCSLLLLLTSAPFSCSILLVL